ncbi:hypothetical protein LJC31_00295 [Synergistaceae bacterium OttesenSCG-928-I11]|nr:hypothetical protein [Synergistaceae bacterium OttesenSCG-928-I11]
MKKIFIAAAIVAFVSAGAAFAYSGGHHGVEEGAIPNGAYEHAEHGGEHEFQAHGEY